MNSFQMLRTSTIYMTFFCLNFLTSQCAVRLVGVHAPFDSFVPSNITLL
jgi:hypothetical protein